MYNNIINYNFIDCYNNIANTNMQFSHKINIYLPIDLHDIHWNIKIKLLMYIVFVNIAMPWISDQYYWTVPIM